MSEARKRIGSKNGSPTADEIDGATTMFNRRALLRNAGLAAGGGAAVALTGLGAKHASAANGNPVILGASNTATSGTTITTTSGSAMYGQTSDPSSAALNGIDNSSTTGGAGVLGYSIYGSGVSGTSSDGFAVNAYSYNSIGVVAQSLTSSPLWLVPSAHTGPLTTGTHNSGEIYLDSSLALWLCTVSGTPGTWSPILVAGLTNNVGAAQTVLNASVPGVAAMNVFNLATTNSHTSGLYVEVGGSSGLPAYAAVIGNTTLAGLPGVFGGSTAGSGIVGMTSAPATAGADIAGVVGSDVSSSGSAGVIAISDHGYGLAAYGGRAQVYLQPGGVAGPPTSGAHTGGELFMDAVAVLWICTAAGSPGTWVQSLAATTNSVGTTPTVIVAATGATAVLSVANNSSGGGNGSAILAKGGGVSGINPKAVIVGDTNQAGLAAVAGANNAGVAVLGSASTAAGVAVHAVGTSGATGLSASSDSGTALQVAGSSTFSGPSTFSLSGLATVAAGSRSIVVPSVSLRSTSLVLATIQQVAAGYSVESAVPNASTNSITIRLSKTVASTITAGIKVAWFVVN